MRSNSPFMECKILSVTFKISNFSVNSFLRRKVFTGRLCLGMKRDSEINGAEDPKASISSDVKILWAFTVVSTRAWSFLSSRFENILEK